MTEASHAGGGLIVVVDDEADLRRPVVEYLQLEGFNAREADGGAALDAIMAETPVDLVVLDVNMPGEDGFSIARRLRAAGPTGIIMLTAKSGLVDRVVGLEIGADDYIAKPFDLRELLARVRAVYRRLNAPLAPAEARAPEDETDYVKDFWVRGKTGTVRVPTDAIEWIEAEKDYVLLHTGGRTHMMRITMAALEQRLDPRELMRVHRSAFVRPASVVELKRAKRAVCLRLANGAEAPVGPQYLDAVERRLQLS